MTREAISRQPSAFSRSVGRAALVLVALAAVAVLGATNVTRTACGAQAATVSTGAGAGRDGRSAEPAGAPGAAASRDARRPREVAAMATAPSFASVFDEVREQNELRDGLRAAHAAQAVSGQAGSPADSRCHTDIDAALAAVRGHLDTHGVSVERLAKAIDVRPNVVRTLLESPSSIPTEHREPLIQAAAAWVEHDARARALKRAACVPTAVTRAIAGLARAVRATRTIGLVVGGAGLGKSHALDALAAEVPGQVIVVRVAVDARHARSFVRAVGRAASGGLDTRHAWSIGAGIESLRRGGGLLAVDEAQRLSPWALEALRDLYDAGDVGVLLIGTRALGRHVAVEDDPAVGPLASRIALRLDLDSEILGGGADGRPRRWLDTATLREILVRHVAGEFDVDALKVLVGVANDAAYHLRTTINAAKVAACLAGRGGQGGSVVIRVTDVNEALRLGGQSA